MKASALLMELQRFIEDHGDGPVAISALETMPNVLTTGITTDIPDGSPIFLLYPEGVALTEYKESLFCVK